MIIQLRKDGFHIVTETEHDSITEYYQVEKAVNGANYVTLSSVPDCFLSISEGNTKTGEKCVNFNLSIEYTCNHACECYKLKKCYAENGCYMYANNQAKYSENVNFYKNHDSETFINAIQLSINTFRYDHFRYFTCGDIPNIRFIDCMVTIAKNNPAVRFWSYTKKYSLVNRWIDENGQLPENLVIIFSHWLNENGTYFPMDNPHNLPTSEFIPYGKEELAEKVTHICPCSDPTVKATCLTCDHACYKLQCGESMALLEHSTKQTKARDKAIKAAKKALK